MDTIGQLKQNLIDAVADKSSGDDHFAMSFPEADIRSTENLIGFRLVVYKPDLHEQAGVCYATLSNDMLLDMDAKVLANLLCDIGEREYFDALKADRIGGGMMRRWGKKEQSAHKERMADLKAKVAASDVAYRESLIEFKLDEAREAKRKREKYYITNLGDLTGCTVLVHTKPPISVDEARKIRQKLMTEIPEAKHIIVMSDGIDIIDYMDFDDEIIEKTIDSLFETVEKEGYVHSRSEETFDAIAGLWFLGDGFESVLASIARSHIVSSFLLKCLGLIYGRMRLEYDLPEFQAEDLTNSNVRESFLSGLQKLKDDDRFVRWLQNSLFPVCIQLLNRVEGDDLEAISELGNLSDSIERLAEQHALREDGEMGVYDSVFQFADELRGLTDRASNDT